MGLWPAFCFSLIQEELSLCSPRQFDNTNQQKAGKEDEETPVTGHPLSKLAH